MLPTNALSEPVESPYGFHVIKLLRRRSAEIRASHILILVEPTPGDVDRARERAEELKGRLESGEDFQLLREEYGDPAEPDSLEVPFNQLSELPPGFANADGTILEAAPVYPTSTAGDRRGAAGARSSPRRADAGRGRGAGAPRGEWPERSGRRAPPTGRRRSR